MTRSSRKKKDGQQERRFETEIGQRFPQPAPVEPATEPTQDTAVTR